MIPKRWVSLNKRHQSPIEFLTLVLPPSRRISSQISFIEYPTEVVMLAVHYYYRFKVSLDDVVELMIMRGFHLSHQTVHNWLQTFGVQLGLKLGNVDEVSQEKNGMLMRRI